MSITIRVEGAEELIRKLTTLEQMNRVKSVIAQEGRWLAAKMREYPNKASMPNPLISSNERVRRGFFYHLKRGDITVPYNRGGGKSERLGEKWTSKASRQGWAAIVENNASYAQLVQGSRQTLQHKASGWVTADKAKTLYGDEIVGSIRAALEREVKNVG